MFKAISTGKSTTYTLNWRCSCIICNRPVIRQLQYWNLWQLGNPDHLRNTEMELDHPFVSYSSIGTVNLNVIIIAVYILSSTVGHMNNTFGHMNNHQLLIGKSLANGQHVLFLRQITRGFTIILNIIIIIIIIIIIGLSLNMEWFIWHVDKVGKTMVKQSSTHQQS